MFKKIKSRIIIPAVGALTVLAMQISASAETTIEAVSTLTAEDKKAIQDGFIGMVADLKSTVLPIIFAGMGIFILFMAVRYGKRALTSSTRG